MSVSRDFALRSLAALLGNNTAASVTLTFLQTIVGCVKYNILLRHHLNLCVLLWLCCPLEWWHESDSEAEEERIRRPVLRTLHETAISSRAFETLCFPCPVSDRSWTLLHAVCSYLRRSQTAHTCDQQLEKEQALKAREEAKKWKKREAKKEEHKEAKKRKSCKAEAADKTARKEKKRTSQPPSLPPDDRSSECSDELDKKLPELREEPDEVEVEVEVSATEHQEEPRGSKESRTIQMSLPLDVAYIVLQRLLACCRPTANYLSVAHVENPDPETAIWRIGKEDERIDLAVVSGVINAAMAERLGTTQKQNLISRSASSKVALLPNRPSESSRMGRSGSRREQDHEGLSRSRPRAEEERRKSTLPRRKGDAESQKILLKPKARPSESEGSLRCKPRPLGISSRWKRVDRMKTPAQVHGQKQDVYWEPTGKENVDIDLTSVGYHEWFERILADNAKARDRKPFITWGMPSSDKAKQVDAIRINGKFGPHANHDYIIVPRDMKKNRKTVIVRYKDQPGWYVVRDRVPLEDKEELQNPDDVDVALIFAVPPRFYRLESNGVVTNMAF